MRNLAAVIVLSLALSGCGSKETPRPETENPIPPVSSAAQSGASIAESETGTSSQNSVPTAGTGTAAPVPPKGTPAVKEASGTGTPEAGTGVDETEIREATSEIDRLFEGIADAPSEKSGTGESR